ncbi:MAG: SAM-dependent methyltransferase [Micavibrio aeruginosavorus]|uniref:SAM-dependent methyltransferase n=1 Tax=Micavibrio aeruginosavorus TaxID=349221 RepID=A0A2W5PN20_9BACT|nr:MAG: SAM-dependent methyltransferase [Micavibrio aeruginosavorus]
MLAVFDRAQIRRQRERANPYMGTHGFLFDWSAKQLTERLDIVRRQFPLCVQIGARGPVITNSIVTDCIGNADILCEEDFFPFAKNSIDLVVSNLALHTVNDLPGALLQIRQSLKPDGLFLATMFGGETLYELRACLSEAELELSNGLSPRVAPFADKQQMGGLLQRAGFALPVVDSDIVTVTYSSIFSLMKDLRLMGEGNAIAERAKNFTPRRLFMRAGEMYAQKFSDPDGRIRASFEVIFLLGWSPHDSQQKPLRPGTAQTRLADALMTQEIGAGEKPQ